MLHGLLLLLVVVVGCVEHVRGVGHGARVLGRVPEGEHVEGGGGSAVQHLAQRRGFLPGRGHFSIAFNICFLELRWSI